MPSDREKFSAPSLPIDALLPELLASLELTPNLVLQASPGSGKTTRVPAALLKSAFRGDREILVLEPRRLAAKWAARRVAEERSERVGETVGYQFRFENVTSGRTRLRFLTEGMLMRRFLGDARMDNIGAVVLDEFHERHLHGDIALAYLRHLQQTSRPDLRLLVMSATLDAEPLTRFLGDCPTFKLEAPLHPVQLEYLPSPAAKHLDALVRDAVGSALSGKGDILVFLPGMAEIRRAASAVADLAERHGVHVLPLHGELSREEQDLAMNPNSRRKIILSTNVAETSLTIPGVTTVIDSGLHRQASYSWWSGVPALKTRPTSKASAIQRAGRAGRLGPGRCLRLYTRGDFDGRAPFDAAEIRRADFTQTYLELMALGVSHPEKFPWFEAPPEQSMRTADELLRLLGAVRDEKLTPMGRAMAQVPAHPRLSRMLLEAQKTGEIEAASQLAALISDGDLDRIDALEQLNGRLDSRTARLLLQSLPEAPRVAKGKDRMAFCVLTGFPDRVAQKRKGAGTDVEFVFASGGSARVENSGFVAHSDLFVALDVQEQQHLGQARSALRVRSLVRIEPEWLFDLEGSLLEESSKLVWNTTRECVEKFEQLRYGQLVLSEARKPLTESDQEEAARLLLQYVTGIERTEAVEEALARLELVRKHYPELGIETPTFATLLRGKTSLQEVREMSWTSEILGRFEHLTPSQLTFPNGKKTKIYYKPNQPPWVESRLQDFFGVRKPLTILEGRCPLTLHLLAPNHRAVQVTTDLMGFWDRAYPEVRRELARRYPRHAWPENPREAEPIIRKKH